MKDKTIYSEFLGNQNPFPELNKSALEAKATYKTAYDTILNELFQKAMMDYFNGEITLEEAYNSFYQQVSEHFPDLVR